jgi:SNF2 family DNA or RNA helicase
MFCVVKETPYGPKVLGGRNLPVLNRVLKPRMSRLTLADTQATMPAVTTDTISLPPVKLDLSGVNDDALATLRAVLAGEEAEDFVADLGALEPHLSTLRRLIGLAKVPALVDLLKTELHGGQEKMVVFYQHTDVGRQINEGLGQIPTVVIDGATKDKSAVVERFKNDPNCRVLLAQIVAGGTGLDGMQHATNRVLLAEYAWTPAVNEQAIARVARAGQQLPVRASYVSLAGSLDEQITRSLIRKNKIVKEVLDG